MIIDFTAAKKHKNSPHFLKKDEGIPLYCRHDKIIIDDHARIINCQQCGKVVDPYDYVLALASKEARLFASLAQLKKEQQELMATREKLKNDVRNAKARLKAVHQRDALPDAQTLGVEKKDRQSCLNDIKEKLKP